MHRDGLSHAVEGLLTALAVVLLGVGVGACGRTGGGAKDARSQHAIARDRDNDADNNDDDAHDLYYGHAAGPAERRELTALVTGYYAAGAADDGAKACSLLYPLISETIAEDYRHIRDLRGPTCAVVLTNLFRVEHTLLARKNATMKIYAIRVNGDRALVLLSFATAPEVRQLLERRAGSNTWLLTSRSDTIME